MLDLVAAALEAEGLSHVRLDGSTPARARAQAIAAFQQPAPAGPAAFLISLKAGGVGLNLTAGSQVHLVDPFWNAAVEEQAQDRVHRLGQARDVDVWRYVAADTIEERMVEMQERKRALAAAAFDRQNTAEAARAARIADLRLLMRV